MKNIRKKRGFTLIELVIVIAIIAILAAIAIPRYQKSKEQAAITAHNANVSMLKTAGLVRLNEMDKSNEKEVWNKSSQGIGYVDKWPKVPKANSDKLKGIDDYTVTIDFAEGSVVVYPDEIEKGES